MFCERAKERKRLGSIGARFSSHNPGSLHRGRRDLFVRRTGPSRSKRKGERSHRFSLSVCYPISSYVWHKRPYRILRLSPRSKVSPVPREIDNHVSGCFIACAAQSYSVSGLFRSTDSRILQPNLQDPCRHFSFGTLLELENREFWIRPPIELISPTSYQLSLR